MTIHTHRPSDLGMTARAYLADLWYRLVPFTIMRRSTAYDREHNAFVLGLDAGAAGYRALPNGKVYPMSTSIEIEKFYTRLDGGSEVGFRVDPDLRVKLDSTLGRAEGGDLLIRLNVDGEGFDEVHVDPPAGSGVTGRTAPVILREVVEKLRRTADVHDALEGAVAR